MVLRSPLVEYEQMDVVRGGHVVEDPQTVAFFGFKEPAYQSANYLLASFSWFRFMLTGYVG
jgi:hypothetical protein